MIKSGISPFACSYDVVGNWDFLVAPSVISTNTDLVYKSSSANLVNAAKGSPLLTGTWFCLKNTLTATAGKD